MRARPRYRHQHLCGGTFITAGTLAVVRIAHWRRARLTFTGGTLQLTQSFDLASTRAVTLNAAAARSTPRQRPDARRAITGSGGLTKIGSGTLTLTGANTYTGGTTISAGTLQLGNGGTTGSIVGNVTDNGALVFNRSDARLRGVISGTGAVTKIGTGTTVLTGDNTYTGGTTITAGTLQLGNGGTTGSIVGNVVEQRHAGLQPLRCRHLRRRDLRHRRRAARSAPAPRCSPAPTPTPAAPRSRPARCSSAMAAPAARSPATSRTTARWPSTAATPSTFAGVISRHRRRAARSAPARTTLTGANTYTGGTTITAGTLQLGNGGTSGSITGDVVEQRHAGLQPQRRGHASAARSAAAAASARAAPART